MKISLILPYWDRQEAANRALERLDALYGDLDLEVIVVDDGNRVRFVPPPGRLDIRVILLPEKDVPKSPATCWNAGARVASGEILVISCIEVLHDQPVLQQMADAVAAGGPDAYVLAAAFCPELNEWHCHSEHVSGGAPAVPPDTGRAFCGAMHRDLYFKAGGWDEDFRDGAGWEDLDFINRMLRAGAKFQIRDDLIVTHPKAGAQIDWPDGAFDRNRRLYEQKWAAKPQSLAVVCVEMGDYCGRGERYVRTLKAMVDRHLTVPHTFYCITDAPKSGINCIAADPRAPGWWQKIHQFKHGMFAEDKILSFDLDTFVIGNINNIVALDTDLALIRDFWRPQFAMNGVMLWRNGGLAHLFWDFYQEQGFPTEYEFGDGGWMGDQSMPYSHMRHHMLQDQFPGQFVSYKTECMKVGREYLKAPPIGARVMCFHGHPRPHEAAGWARGLWNQHKPAQMDTAPSLIHTFGGGDTAMVVH